MTMSAGEQLHRMTENVYKNTIEGFNPEIRNLITLGRAYEKVSQNVTQVAKDYFDALMKVGELASETKSARQLGQSLLQIAETYRQIEAEREIKLHAFRKELLNPLEAKVETDIKAVLQAQKAYLSENKVKAEAVEKCKGELKKVQKKASKNHSEKYVEKEQKSSEELQHLTKQLYDFRNEGLREVWLEEKKRYCYLVERYCSLVKNDAAFFGKAQSVLRHRMPKWTESCAKPEKLNEECEDTLNTVFSGPLGNPLQMELRTSKRLYERNILLAQSEEQKEKERTTPVHSHEAPERPASADMADAHTSAASYSATLPNPRRDKGSGMRHTKSMIHKLPQGVVSTLPQNAYLRRVSEGADNIAMDVQKMTKVQALYSHIASSDSQLNFAENDIIALVGPKNNGWYYGHNIRTKRSGWFPIAYTHPIQTALTQQNGGTSPLPHQSPSQITNQSGAPPLPPLSTNPAFNKGMAASMDNIMDGRSQYPSPDYHSDHHSPGVAPAASTMSLPHSLMPGVPTDQHGSLVEGHVSDGTNGLGRRSPTSSVSSSASLPTHHSKDTASIEEEEGDSASFPGVQLRKTVTNDRSAPMIPKDYSMNEYARY
ncbi:brain-specific angiogenesis inhibitor 1-associated protein 2-like isoform X2 [Acanthaster planci]|uniref:Brain-specific angiogenesis inhibitor 1-associated protein 2-like isoform X2 n=1 Tax=Acanthaster planci TaxID=133434 RepID=A0A8B7XV65_ACAPL|nr:brain-specific angiogenesis inhibitor 1-associated protein 2-like isoform X2 [Acanthaster planci]